MHEQLNNILPQERVEELFSIGIKKSIKAQDFFIRAGEKPRKIGFIFSGLFRYVYTNEKGDEFTKAIMAENNFISSYSAMAQDRQSYFAIEALEDSQILEINWNKFMSLVNNNVFWLKFLMGFVEKGYIIKEKRERDLLLLDAKTRYKNFLYEFPNIDQRVKQGIIASYLGIKPETLSRIRKKIVF